MGLIFALASERVWGWIHRSEQDVGNLGALLEAG